MCFNKRVVMGLAGLGLVILVLAPQVFRSVAPLLLVAACPLSMVFMMRGMSGGAKGGACAADNAEAPTEHRLVATDVALSELRDEIDTLRAQLARRDQQHQN